jgi:uncharacterized protein involved in response to NO
MADTTDYDGPVILANGFRPFFLCMGLWGALAIPVWIGVWTGYMAYGGALDPFYWHIHEMIFGFVGAAMGGFLLTAVPEWTGRPPMRGRPLLLLVLLWIAGRLALWFGGAITPTAAAIVDLAYLAALAFWVATELVSGRNWRNLPVLLVVVLLIGANALFHAEAIESGATGESGVRLSVALVVILLSLIGGRVVPAFTRNWLAARNGPAIPAPMQWFDIATLGISTVSLLAWAIAPDATGIGMLLIFAGVLHLIRLLRWRGWRVLGDPLIAILHLGYLWIAVGTFVLGLAIEGAALRESVGLHLLTIGAMGTMILAVATRASLGHTGRPLAAGQGTCIVYALVTLAVLARILFEFSGALSFLWVAAAAWTAAFALFVFLYAPVWFAPRVTAPGP